MAGSDTGVDYSDMDRLIVVPSPHGGEEGVGVGCAYFNNTPFRWGVLIPAWCRCSMGLGTGLQVFDGFKWMVDILKDCGYLRKLGKLGKQLGARTRNGDLWRIKYLGY